MGRAGHHLLGPLPLRRRWRVFFMASAVAAGAFVLHGMLNGWTARGGLFETLAGIASFVALYVLLFRLVHPAAVRWMLRRTTLPVYKFFPSSWVRWYLGTGNPDDLPPALRDTQTGPR